MVLVDIEGSKRVDIGFADFGYAGFVKCSICER